MIGLPFLQPGEHTPCSETDPEAFFPVSGNAHHGVFEVCASCPVMEECAEYGVRHHYLSGVWGGLGAPARRAAHKRRGLPDLTPRYETAVWAGAPATRRDTEEVA